MTSNPKMLVSLLKSLFLCVITLIFMVLMSVALSLAQSIVADQRPVIDSLKQQAQELVNQVDAMSMNDGALVDLRLKLDSLARRLLDFAVSFHPRMTEINARLKQLDTTPAVGQAESQTVIDERKSLNEEKAQMNAMIGEAEDVSLSVNRTIEHIGEMRRGVFTRTLLQRVDIGHVLSKEVIAAASEQLIALGWLFASFSFQSRSLGMAIFSILVAALILYEGERHIGSKTYRRDTTVENPAYLTRLSVAFWSTMIRSMSVGLFLTVTYFSLHCFGLLRPEVATISLSLFIVIGVIYFIHSLAGAVLSPDRPNWRLVRVAPRSARLLTFLVTAIALVNGLNYLLNTINQVLSSPLLLTVVESLLATLLVGLLIVAIAFIKPRQSQESQSQGGARQSKSWPKALRIFLLCFGVFPIVMALLGYIGLARFVSQQIVLNVVLLATMYFGFLAARAITVEQAFGSTALGRMIQTRFGMDDSTLDQLGLVVNILIDVIVLLVGIPLILLQLGFQWSELQFAFLRLATGFQVGNISLSLTGIFTGLLFFILGYFLTRWFQRWLHDSVLIRGHLDPAICHSIRTVVGYLGIGTAALMAISAAGINLSSLALIAGGLSLGIGIGLQNIVSNFVSGLVLLFERPFKIGDWVEVDGVSGIVNKINVRATEVETFQKQTVIVPNSSLINGNVTNWTHHDKLGRVEIPVGVAYGSNVRAIRKLLLEIAYSHPMVLRVPEPSVAFIAFGDLSLNFELRVFLVDISSRTTVRSDLRFAIVERFTELGIKIPSLQDNTTLKRKRKVKAVEKLPIRKQQTKRPKADSI